MRYLNVEEACRVLNCREKKLNLGTEQTSC